MDPRTDKRVDPADGVAYTYDEVAAFYEGKYNKTVIEDYWENMCKRRGKAGAEVLAPETEKRLDPEDGAAYTYDELAAFYQGKYERTTIEDYWENRCQRKGNAGAQAKVK